ncbi:MAG: hypothetical protein HY332_05765 [Chloroflexi bacterium]|nr:hypothetical protein [Chloroflexota bacterium]
MGFTPPTPPCAATLCGVPRHLDRAPVEATWGAWAAAVLARLPAAPSAAEAVALDGKTLRGSRRPGALDVHVLAALSHRLGRTLGQPAVSDQTKELTVAVPLRRGLVLEGQICTLDALLTQRAIAQTIVDGGGDDVLLGKEHQPPSGAPARPSSATRPQGTSNRPRRPSPVATGGSRGAT